MRELVRRKQEFTIPGRLPAMNEIISANRTNRYRGAQQKVLEGLRVRAAIRQAALTRMDRPVRITTRFYERDHRRDPDGVFSGGWKFILDALQQEGIIGNDNQLWLGGNMPLKPELYIDRDNPRIEVEIEEVEP